ncbi:ComEC/Rec2 family competence protein [Psychrobacter sp. 1U1]|uniref:ComEC/Rec2 family competence protein n=2 Tax=unclassified Psychrobacter TaxID=196806 RepID=UPI003F4469D2
MYWTIGISIIIAMVGTLSIGTVDFAQDRLLAFDLSIASDLIWLSLIVTAIIFLFLLQRSAALPSISNYSLHKRRTQNHTISSKFIRYLLMTIIASVLVFGSALQALSAYQQAETTKITEPMQVRAWVTIKGISDSVYDSEINSGYRQVATLQLVEPLVSKLTSQDLQAQTLSYINNSLSSKGLYNKDINGDKNLEHRVLLSAYPKRTSSNTQTIDLNGLQPGDQLLMTLKLVPLVTSGQTLNNPTGFDSYRWLRGRHIDGMATIMATGEPIRVLDSSSTMLASNAAFDSFLNSLRTHIDQWRWQLRQHFYADWLQQTTAEQQAKAVTLSLLTGDRSLINHETKDLYQLAGISHLLAISGTHVLFLAIILAGAAVWLVNHQWPALYRNIPRWQVRWWVMIGVAFIYALFTGFDVPAARTAWMLLAIGLVRLTLLPISTMRVLLAIAVLMAWFDPYVLWQAGYWLSFVAVALLLKYDDTSYQRDNVALAQHRHDITDNNHISSTLLTQIGLTGKRVFKLQFWLFIALLPITLLLFGKASLWGLFINLFAIGLFGWVIVPLNLLAGLCYLLLPTVADSIWALVSIIVASLHKLIAWLTSLPALSDAWLYTSVNMAILLMALLVMMPWLLPRGLISRGLALPPLSLLVMTVYANQQSLVTAPTLYVLPTGDQYLSATVLQYPIVRQHIDNSSHVKNNNERAPVSGAVYWLFLADHRPYGNRTMPSTMTADDITAHLAQQLGTLSIDQLEGVVIQTSVPILTDTLSSKQNNSKIKSNIKKSELLPMSVLQLNQRMPINQYWQAGRHERWAAYQQLYLEQKQSARATTITAQSCEQGKTWQLDNKDMALQAMTGWRDIDDSSVWDCTIAIASKQPIRVIRYDANNPQQSLQADSQTFIPPTPISKTSQKTTHRNGAFEARVVLNADTHHHLWQMWPLLCSADSFAYSTSINYPTQWLGHSTSQVTTEALSRQQIDKIITYDRKTLEIALRFDALP